MCYVIDPESLGPTDPHHGFWVLGSHVLDSWVPGSWDYGYQILTLDYTQVYKVKLRKCTG